jgi:hypothetical protein
MMVLGIVFLFVRNLIWRCNHLKPKVIAARPEIQGRLSPLQLDKGYDEITSGMFDRLSDTIEFPIGFLKAREEFNASLKRWPVDAYIADIASDDHLDFFEKFGNGTEDLSFADIGEGLVLMHTSVTYNGRVYTTGHCLTSFADPSRTTLLALFEQAVKDNPDSVSPNVSYAIGQMRNSSADLNTTFAIDNLVLDISFTFTNKQYFDVFGKAPITCTMDVNVVQDTAERAEVWSTPLFAHDKRTVAVAYVVELRTSVSFTAMEFHLTKLMGIGAGYAVALTVAHTLVVMCARYVLPQRGEYHNLMIEESRAFDPEEDEVGSAHGEDGFERRVSAVRGGAPAGRHELRGWGSQDRGVRQNRAVVRKEPSERYTHQGGGDSDNAWMMGTVWE